VAPFRNDVVPSQEINICNLVCRSSNSNSSSSTFGLLGEKSQQMGIRSARRKIRSRTGKLASAEASGGAMASKAGQGQTAVVVASAPI
jgi:hypothetical protein